MKTKQVLKKIEALQKQGQKLDLKYLKTRNYFKNYADTCGFYPDTFQGHSYSWYELTKRIKGVNVLNCYGYSNQTIKHVSKVRSVCDALGIKVREIEAPKGLQDLNIAMFHNLLQVARYNLEAKHARKDNVSWKTKRAKAYQRDVDFLKSLGVKCTKNMINEATVKASIERMERLERQLAKRATYIPKTINSLSTSTLKLVEV